jgi:uncharacterized membrane protein YhaH (DUF805 family)
MQGLQRVWRNSRGLKVRRPHIFARAGWWLVSASTLVVALPSTGSAFHMSQPPENPLILIVTFIAVIVLLIGVIIAITRDRSRGKVPKKRDPRHRGKGKGRSAFLR